MDDFGPHFCPGSQCFASQIVSFAETNKGGLFSASWLQKLNSTFIFLPEYKYRNIKYVCID